MNSFKSVTNITGWLVFAISFVVYALSAESTGSLWDCGEFILGAYKLQVVHPPGAPLFVLIGRVFAMFGDWFSSNPSGIAVAVNLMSGMASAFAAMFVCWVTILLGKMALYGRESQTDSPTNLGLALAGLVAGLTTAFSTSIWFSAVEGEVYALSTFFTTLTLWAVIKWYMLPNESRHDKWIIFAVYASALSIGVHLLSLLTFPALALFYYYKKYPKHTLFGAVAAAGVGLAFIIGMQTFIITGIPSLWLRYELLMVNSFGLPVHSGLIPLILTIGAVFYFAVRYAHRKRNAILQQILVGALVSIAGFSTVAIVVIRANANPPVNMNSNFNAARLLSYLNREQYGERPLLKGPYFGAEPIGTKSSDRYGRVGDRYEVVDYKIGYEYNASDEMLFPRMSHYDESRKRLYRYWMDGKEGKPTMGDNLGFFMRYQVNWMYWRYFMWNFAGRQNGQQGFFPWDPSSGNWMSGIKALDSNRLYNQDSLPTAIKEDYGRNKYYLIPLLMGILGILFHLRKSRKDFLALLVLFIITGLGIIVYSNQPPNEPRERDYVLVGSFFTFAIWVGMGVLYLMDLLRNKAKISPVGAAAIAGGIALIAPLLMGSQNFDDQSRRGHTGARDYASNFLESCEPNAIIFTYGDNDTYPLWYAQEVEGIRTDVRVVNLSLIAVDWYIDQMRRKVNNSAAIKFTIPSEEYRGYKRNQVFYYSPDNQEREMSLSDAIRFIGESHPLRGGSRSTESYLPARRLYIPVDRNRAVSSGWVSADDPELTDRLNITIDGSYITKDQLAVLDIINSNLYERPIYFSVTCTEDRLLNMGQHLQLEGLGLRIMPISTSTDRAFRIFGLGRVAGDKFVDNVINKFRWGNFDKKKTFVDKAYNASIYAHKMIMLRTAYTLVQRREFDKAIQLIDKQFEAFPHFNFPYDGTSMAFINLYLESKAYEKAKPHMQILANHIQEYQVFFRTLDPMDLEAGFSGEKAEMDRTMVDLIRMADEQGDDAFADELTERFGPFIDTDELKRRAGAAPQKEAEPQQQQIESEQQ